MKRWTLLACMAVLALALSAPAEAGLAGKKSISLDQYKATVNQAVYRDLLTRYDLVTVRHLANGKVTVDLVLARNQVSALRADGVTVKLRKNKFGLSARQFAAAQAQNGFTVWRDFDSADGFRAQMYAIARRNPQLVKLEVIGRSVQGREIIALKVTQGARDVPDGTRPAVLYTSMQHAREWISP
jgi:Zinc carboxypeptidase